MLPSLQKDALKVKGKVAGRFWLAERHDPGNKALDVLLAKFSTSILQR
ncbi:MAG: hypothetical protein ACTS73_05990 [Arsenophonus sp. NEOnobi-MAG3]